MSKSTVTAPRIELILHLWCWMSFKIWGGPGTILGPLLFHTWTLRQTLPRLWTTEMLSKYLLLLLLYLLLFTFLFLFGDRVELPCWSVLYNWHSWHRSKYKHLPYYNAAVVHRLVDILGIMARGCVLYLLQQVSELFGASVSGADRLLRSHDRANTSTFGVLGRTVHLPALLGGSRTHLSTANH